jgi:transketolase
MLDQTDEPHSSLTGHAIRRVIIEQSRRAGVGHIGSALSAADILAVVYRHLLRAGTPDDPDRDRFVLSKGHASLALYAALWLRGWMARETLDSFCGNDTLLGVHPEHQLPGVDFSTGSLGMGLSFAAGAALAARLEGSRRHSFALLSDAECNEGSTWEAVMFAAHHRLGNLTAFVDMNGQQALGYTQDILSLSPLIDRFNAFGWNAVEVDGHDTEAMRAAVVRSRDGRPRVLLCRTVFGKGISFMEQQIRWHYLPLTDAEFSKATAELDAAACA